MEIPQFHPCSINYLIIKKINEVEYGWNMGGIIKSSTHVLLCTPCVYMIGNQCVLGAKWHFWI